MYRNIAYVTKNKQGYIWISTWDEQGNRIEYEEPHDSYIFYEDPKRTDSPYKSLFNKPLVKKTFNSAWSRKQWCDQNKGVRLFEELPPVREYLINKYCGQEREPSFSQYPFRVFCLDIEVQIEDEFPTADQASYPINVISLTDSLEKKLHVWATQTEINKIISTKKKQEINQFLHNYAEDMDIIYHLFDDEISMLEHFIDWWNKNFPDIVTGWNCVDVNSPIWYKNHIDIINNIRIGDELSYQNVLNVFPTSKKQKHSIYLNNGTVINSSKDHKFLIKTLPHGKYTNFLSKNDKFVYNTVEEMLDNIKDNNLYVQIPKHENTNDDLTYEMLFSNIDLQKYILKECNDIVTFKNGHSINKKDTIDLDILYTLGLIYTDGSLNFSDNTITIYNKNKDVLNICSNVIDRYKNRSTKKQNNINNSHNKNNHSWNWVRGSTSTVLGLITQELLYQNNKKHLNLKLLSMLSKSQWFSFVSGLIDGDGCIAKNGSITIYDHNNNTNVLQQLMLWNNIYCTTPNTNVLYIAKTKHNLNICKEYFNLRIDYKHNRLTNIICNHKSKPNKSNKINYMDCGDFYAIKVDKIEVTNQYIDMIDISTSNHSFNICGVTTHNCDAFDVKYIINRIINVFGKDKALLLSPLSNVYTIFDRDLNTEIFRISGISCIDYLRLYKKITLKSQQSFKLDYIGQLELGFGKLDYHEKYNSIRQFMEADFAEFTKYNMLDSLIVYLLDKKLRFINLMRTICNFGLVEYEAITRSLPYIIGALCIEARKRGVYFLTELNKDQEQTEIDQKANDYSFAGAFVYPTIANYYNQGIASFDFNSLYPNIMITLNLSPDTKVGKVITNNLDSDRIQIRHVSGKLITMTKEQFKQLLDTQCSISATNVLYVKSTIKKGIVPGFLQDLYESRKAKKKEMLKYEELSHKIDESIKKLDEALSLLDQQKDQQKIDIINQKKKQLLEQQNEYDIKATQLDAIQHSFKIYLNSSYGAFGSVFYPCFDLDNAESVTQTGQVIIKEMLRFIQEYFSNTDVFKYQQSVDKEPIIVAGDTDSCSGNTTLSIKQLKIRKIQLFDEQRKIYKTLIIKPFDKIKVKRNNNIQEICGKDINIDDVIVAGDL